MSGQPAQRPLDPARPETPKSDSRVPVIVRKRRHGAGHVMAQGGRHGGAWKVAYADFVTAMMAFFLVMWLVQQSPEVKQSVGQYFRDPVAFTEKGRGGAGLLDGGTKLLEGPSQGEPSGPPREDERVARERLLDRARQILAELTGVPALHNLAGQIEIEPTEDGLRLQLMESHRSTFFDLGRARLSPEGEEIVMAIGGMLAPLPYFVSLEGHTDSRPFASSDGYTNWELSADRANAARKLLERAGVESKRIESVSGYADTRLRFAEVPGDPRNRRIAIVVRSPAAAATLDTTLTVPAS